MIHNLVYQLTSQNNAWNKLFLTLHQNMSTILLQWKSHPNRDNMHRSSTIYKWKQTENISKQLCWWILMGEDLSLEEAVLWIID